jgi:hypothetical protein
VAEEAAEPVAVAAVLAPAEERAWEAVRFHVAEAPSAEALFVVEAEERFAAEAVDRFAAEAVDRFAAEAVGFAAEAVGFAEITSSAGASGTLDSSAAAPTLTII